MVAGIVIGWIILSILAGVLTKNKGRGFAIGFFLSLLLSPVIGLIAGAVMKTGEEKKSENIETEFAYKLEKFSYEDGNGYMVIRTSDGQKLQWRTLPISDGLESIPVSGESHHMKDLQKKCFEPGEEIQLIPEPNNPHSKTAVGVWDREKKYQVGYIPKEEEERIFKKISDGWLKKCIVMWEIYEGGKRVSLRLLLIGQNADIELS